MENESMTGSLLPDRPTDPQRDSATCRQGIIPSGAKVNHHQLVCTAFQQRAELGLRLDFVDDHLRRCREEGICNFSFRFDSLAHPAGSVQRRAVTRASTRAWARREGPPEREPTRTHLGRVAGSALEGSGRSPPLPSFAPPAGRCAATCHSEAGRVCGRQWLAFYCSDSSLQQSRLHCALITHNHR